MKLNSVLDENTKSMLINNLRNDGWNVIIDGTTETYISALRGKENEQ